MTTPQFLSFAVIIAMMAAFIWGRFRYDVVAAVALLIAVAIGVVPFDRAFSGFSDVVTARYSAGLGQAFARLDYDIETDGATYTPFAELAFAEAWRGSFAETGGDAALIGTPATLGQAVTTLGLRSHSAIDVGTQTGLFTAGLAWRHGYGPDNPQATLGFSESDLFVIEGAPQSRDALILEAGLALDIGGQGKLDLTYNGAWAMGPSVSHMITARLRGLF